MPSFMQSKLSLDPLPAEGTPLFSICQQSLEVDRTPSRPSFQAGSLEIDDFSPLEERKPSGSSFLPRSRCSSPLLFVPGRVAAAS